MTTGSGPTPLDVLANDSSSPDGPETLTVADVSQPSSGGTVSIAPGGTGIVFTPEPFARSLEKLVNLQAL